MSLVADDAQRLVEARTGARDRYLSMLASANSPLLSQGDDVREQLIGQFRAVFDAAWAPNASDMVEILSLTIGHQRAASSTDPAASLAAANMIFAAALPYIAAEYAHRGIPHSSHVAAVRLNEAVLRRMAAAAQAYISRLVAGGSTRSPDDPSLGDASSHVLTPRETSVLDNLAAGRTNSAIAAQLHISEATVKRHVATLYRKLGAHNRIEAVIEARALGLLR